MQLIVCKIIKKLIKTKGFCEKIFKTRVVSTVSVLLWRHSIAIVSSFHCDCVVIPLELCHYSIGFVVSFHWFCVVIPLVLQRHSIEITPPSQWNNSETSMEQQHHRNETVFSFFQQQFSAHQYNPVFSFSQKH